MSSSGKMLVWIMLTTMPFSTLKWNLRCLAFEPGSVISYCLGDHCISRSCSFLYLLWPNQERHMQISAEIMILSSDQSWGMALPWNDLGPFVYQATFRLLICARKISRTSQMRMKASFFSGRDRPGHGPSSQFLGFYVFPFYGAKFWLYFLL